MICDITTLPSNYPRQELMKNVWLFNNFPSMYFINCNTEEQCCRQPKHQDQHVGQALLLFKDNVTMLMFKSMF